MDDKHILENFVVNNPFFLVERLFLVKYESLEYKSDVLNPRILVNKYKTVNMVSSYSELRKCISYHQLFKRNELLIKR